MGPRRNTCDAVQDDPIFATTSFYSADGHLGPPVIPQPTPVSITELLSELGGEYDYQYSHDLDLDLDLNHDYGHDHLYRAPVQRQPKFYETRLSLAVIFVRFVVLTGLAYIACAVVYRQLVEKGRLQRLCTAAKSRLSGLVGSRFPVTPNVSSDAMARLLGLGTDQPQGGIMASVAQGLKNSLPSLVPSGPIGTSPAGLGNINNSCFQNSVLQGLSSLDSMAGYLRAADVLEEQAGRDLSDSHAAVALRNFIEALRSPTNRGRVLWTPSKLKTLNTWQQQDAQEYLVKLLDEVDGEMAKAASASAPLWGLDLEVSTSPTSSPSPSPDDKVTTPGVSYGTWVADTAGLAARCRKFGSPLTGLLAQRVACTSCNHTDGLDLIPFNFLTLNVPLHRNLSYLDEGLDLFTAIEEIEGVDCAKCTLIEARDRLQGLIKRSASSDSPGVVDIDELHSRLRAVDTALEDEDFDWETVRGRCQVSDRDRISSTKTKQTVVARPPQCLIIHINRSVFDETTGAMYKHAIGVPYEPWLNLGRWCIGGGVRSVVDPSVAEEEWPMDPRMDLNSLGSVPPVTPLAPGYECRAIISHYGRHDNGHYVCYKQFPAPEPEADGDGDEELRDLAPTMQWWRLSDDVVSPITEENLSAAIQHGVFMLFYELVVPANDESVELPGQTPLEQMSLEPTTHAEPDEPDEPVEPVEPVGGLPTPPREPSTSLQPADAIGRHHFAPSGPQYRPAFPGLVVIDGAAASQEDAALKSKLKAVVVVDMDGVRQLQPPPVPRHVTPNF